MPGSLPSLRERSLVGPGRVERPTSRLSGVRSNHLSYEPDEVSYSNIPKVSDLQDIDGKRKRNVDGGTAAYCLSTDVRDSS